MIDWDGVSPELERRELLGQPLAERLARSLAAFRGRCRGFRVRLSSQLAFDGAGLELLCTALERYRGVAGQLRVFLRPDPAAFEDYYSLGPVTDSGLVELPVEIHRDSGGACEELVIDLPARRYPLPFPAGFGRPRELSLPRALLLPLNAPHSLLFANQIAIFPNLEYALSRSPAAWFRALWPSGGAGFLQRLGLAFRSVHRTAIVHPTAVIEGSFIGPECRVGAHAVVRYSVLARGVRLYDGAKVEASVIGEGSWLMQDLVFQRAVTERGVFLIHGPYQFSYFEHNSAAFATILMDYRPDGAIKVPTDDGELRDYQGALLGSVFREGARSFGGTLLAPGRVVPAGVWLAPPGEDVHRLGRADLPLGCALSPAATRKLSGGFGAPSGSVSPSSGNPPTTAPAETRSARAESKTRP